MIYKLADTLVSIDTILPAARRLLEDYRSEGEPEMCLSTDWADIRAESARADSSNVPSAGLETQALLRKLSHALLRKDTLLFHGSALAMDGQGYIFAAPSGIGKSTHARLWRERFGDRVVMINDDKPFLKIGGTTTIYGSPWDGKHHLSANASAPLHAIAILERADKNSIRRLEPAEALADLLQQAYREEDMEQVFPLVLRLAGSIPLYKLGCNMESEAAAVAYEGMRG